MESHWSLRILLSSIVLGTLIAEPVRAAESEPTAAWLDQVSQDIRQSEYHFSVQPDGSLSAPNRAHNLRSAFDEKGILIMPRTPPEEEPVWWLELSVTGYGRDGAIKSSETLLPDSDANRVELRREHLIEWYVNDERGIEQGFDVFEPPDQASSELPVVIQMAIQGSVGAY